MSAQLFRECIIDGGSRLLFVGAVLPPQPPSPRQRGPPRLPPVSTPRVRPNSPSGPTSPTPLSSFPFNVPASSTHTMSSHPRSRSSLLRGLFFSLTSIFCSPFHLVVKPPCSRVSPSCTSGPVSFCFPSTPNIVLVYPALSFAFSLRKSRPHQGPRPHLLPVYHSPTNTTSLSLMGSLPALFHRWLTSLDLQFDTFSLPSPLSLPRSSAARPLTTNEALNAIYSLFPFCLT